MSDECKRDGLRVGADVGAPVGVSVSVSVSGAPEGRKSRMGPVHDKLTEACRRRGLLLDPTVLFYSPRKRGGMALKRGLGKSGRVKSVFGLGLEEL